MPPRLLLCCLALAAVAASATTPPDTPLSFTLEHNLGRSGAWAPAGTLAGSLGGALTAARAGRGVVPGLTLTRAATALTHGEEAELKALIAAGGLYKVRATAEGGQAGGAPTTPLLASAPAACVAAARGDAPLKLDGSLTLSRAGDFTSPEALQITGLTFDFLSLRCGEGSGGGGIGGGRAPGEAAPSLAWAPPASSPVLLWLPAAAPPVLPASEPVDRRRGAGAAAPTPPPTGALEGGEGGGGEGEDGEKTKKPPPSWIQRNFIYILPATMVIFNMMREAQPAAEGRRPQDSGRAREE